MHSVTRRLAIGAICASLAASAGQSTAEGIDPSRPLSCCGVKVGFPDAEAYCFAVSEAARHAGARAIDYQDNTDGLTKEDLSYLRTFCLIQGIPGFCESEDSVCDVRRFDPTTRQMRCIIWLNAKTGAALIWGARQRDPVLVLPPEQELALRVGRAATTEGEAGTPAEAAKCIGDSYLAKLPEHEEHGLWLYRAEVTANKRVQERIPSFADEGDVVWEATIRSWHNTMETLVWVHAKTGQLYFLMEPWRPDRRRPQTVPHTRKGIRAGVPNVREATDSNALLISRLASMMWNEDGNMLPNLEGVTTRYVLHLGFDVPGLAKQGESIWECDLGTASGRVRLLIWVNPRNGKTLYVNRMFGEALSAEGAKQHPKLPAR